MPSLSYEKMPASAQFNFEVPRLSITLISPYLSVGLMWPPGWFYILLNISKIFSFCFNSLVEGFACLVMKTLQVNTAAENCKQEKSAKKVIWRQLNAYTFKEEHIIHLYEMACGLSKVEARVSEFHVKICQSTNISKDGLSVEDIDFSQLIGKEVDIITGNDIPKAHWWRNNAYVNRTLL